MKLTDILPESLVFPNVQARSKTEALEFFAREISKVYPDLNEKDLLEVLLERERVSSTGIGSGIAIPHARFEGCKRHVAAFGRIRNGIPFDSIDERPVHLIFLIVGPAGANEAHLKALARISKFLHDSIFRDRLITEDNAHDLYQVIVAKDSEY